MSHPSSSTLPYSGTPITRWGARAGYFALATIPVFLLTRELSARKFPGRYTYPPHFGLFSFLYHLQEGLLVGLIVALVGFAATFIGNRWLRFVIYFPVALWLAWLFVWAMARAAFMIELSPYYAVALLTQPSAISGVGLERGFFYRSVGLAFASMFLMSLAGAYLSRRVARATALRFALICFAVFLLVHIPVRTYVVHHVNRGQQAVLALDDWTPIALPSERLVPGLRPARPSLPNLENPQRTRAYLQWAARLPPFELPRKIDIMWIVVEAFRADAIAEKTTPYLWSHASEFQLKLDRNHWSGGNASQFGLFSMFSGISGYHLQTFIRAQRPIPFFSLLAQNGYRIRVASRGYFGFEQFPQFFFPAATVRAKPRESTPAKTDAAMVDELLHDMGRRAPSRSLDIVTFDATHWPFSFEEEDDIFQPSATAGSHAHFTRTPAEAAEAHNRFGNASHGVDRQIARIMEELRGRGALERTIVIVTGDHGEEFMERGQVFHAGPMNDFQGRPVLWIHFPDAALPAVSTDALTSHVDLVPTLLDFVGSTPDLFPTQGRSLLHLTMPRSALLVSEQGYYFPAYHALITKEYVSRWRHGSRRFLFSGVTRRDGRPVIGDDWLKEANAVYAGAAHEYEVLPEAPAQSPQ